MKILVIDNHDSFVYNIVQLLRDSSLRPAFEVITNDLVTPRHALAADGLILSPGPGIPDEAGHLIDIIARCMTLRPILGICLGHQAIAQVCGARLRQLPRPLHGHCSRLHITDPSDPILANLLQPVMVGRYHSWDVDPRSLPATLRVTSVDPLTGAILSLRHSRLPLFGLQFHPESVMTDQGHTMTDNWLRLVLAQKRRPTPVGDGRLAN